MMSGWQGISAFLIGFLMCVIWAAPSSLPTLQGGDINAVYLGGADGKQYFATHTLMNWTTASTYCIESNMRLASVNTVGQVNLWKQAYNNVTFYDHHWTAGRDSKNITQFVWDHDDSSINSTIVSLEENNLPVLTSCLSYIPSPLNPEFHAHLCINEAYVICEI